MDSFLSTYFLFEVINFKNVWNTMDISKRKNRNFKWKVTQLLAVTLGFKSLVR
jgi:hypothetical protein